MDAKDQELESWKLHKQRIRELKEKGEDYRDELDSRFNREKPTLDANYDNKNTLSYDAIATGASG